ncbi:hypothetical protein P20495_0949 [Pseudoalteromonas sp. BSi20495]|nr:hypothetical protein P20495_0949 [Pseudoalteromonas sp. BSi20495]
MFKQRGIKPHLQNYIYIQAVGAILHRAHVTYEKYTAYKKTPRLN